ncbi:plasminogen-like [Mercenaria mercenaria]|uniref:plasminogen-like n=1 Tax=Mercenaria mercenaria TaxID=6596 RepID=UPI00234F3DD8|nr:plasminogen-like [Mercenaria mercenaria]
MTKIIPILSTRKHDQFSLYIYRASTDGSIEETTETSIEQTSSSEYVTSYENITTSYPEMETTAIENITTSYPEMETTSMENITTSYPEMETTSIHTSVSSTEYNVFQSSVNDTVVTTAETYSSTGSYDCYTVSSEYQGTKSVAENGYTCSTWSDLVQLDDYTNLYQYTYTDPAVFPDDSIAEANNYCRDPDNSGRPWCYTPNHPDVNWGYCDIPKCGVTTSTQGPSSTAATTTVLSTGPVIVTFAVNVPYSLAGGFGSIIISAIRAQIPNFFHGVQDEHIQDISLYDSNGNIYIN